MGRRKRLLMLLLGGLFVGIQGAAAAPHIRDLNEIIQPITTITTYPDGIKEVNIGSGFVIGRRFYTVQHNLEPLKTLPEANTTTYLDGIPMHPRIADADRDIAIFDLPKGLCQRYCNGLSFKGLSDVYQDQHVIWLRKFGGERTFKKARVRNLAFLGDGPPQPLPQACAANVVVEVDQPFDAGSSGSPILDAATGTIIGIIQGSFERDGVRTGFFKPIECVLSALAALQ